MGTARMAAADRKTEIMDAAVARIVTAGFEGLRVRDVAQDVGINNATLHHHFPTKAALVRALVQRFLEGFPVDDAIPGDDRPIEQRVAAYIEDRRTRMRRDPTPFLVLNEMMVLARRDAEVRVSLVALREHWRDYLVATCRDAGLAADEALALAESCRRELLGASIDLCLDRIEGLDKEQRP